MGKSRLVGDEFKRQAGNRLVDLVAGEDHGVALLPELSGGVVGYVALARKERVEHQTSAGGQTLRGEFEHAAQLVRGPEVRHHLGEHDQLILAAGAFHRHENVALDDTDVHRIPFGFTANDVGELTGQLDRVDRAAAPGQGERISAGTGADVEHPARAGIGGFVGQRPHACVGLGAEQRPLAGIDPVVVVGPDGRPLGLHPVVQRGAER